MHRTLGFLGMVVVGCVSTEPVPQTGTTGEPVDGTSSGSSSSSSASATSLSTTSNGVTGDPSGDSSGIVIDTGSTTDDSTTGAAGTTTGDADTTTSGALGGSTSESDSDSFATSGMLEEGSGGVQVQVSGVVRAGVAPGDDGIGTVYIGVRPDFDCFDGTTQYNDVIVDADLSEIGNEVAFSINADLVELSDDESLQVFLDDDGNAANNNDPDPGDMILFTNEFEELAGCYSLGDIGGDVADLVVTLDDVY